jgi:hypothetical protein
MSRFEPVPGLVSEEVFDSFRDSKWPELFGGTAYHSRVKGIPLDRCIDALESTVAISRMEQRDMLADMGIIEQEPRPERLDDIRDFRFTKAGRQVIAACEGLYAPEEYEARDAEARAYLEQARRERAEQLGTQ